MFFSYKTVKIEGENANKYITVYAYSEQFYMSRCCIARCQEFPAIHLLDLLITGAQI